MDQPQDELELNSETQARIIEMWPDLRKTREEIQKAIGIKRSTFREYVRQMKRKGDIKPVEKLVSENPVPITEFLPKGKCNYIVGHPGAGKADYCGEVTESGEIYCPAHREITNVGQVSLLKDG